MNHDPELPSYEHVVRRVHILRELHDETAVLRNASGDAAAVGSTANDDLSEYGETMQTLLSLANLYLEVAADHIVGLHKMLTGGVQTLASASAARGCIEACSYALWILDQEVSSLDRIRRGMSLQYVALTSQRTLLRIWGAADATITSVDEKILNLERVADTFGFQRVRNRKGHRVGIGEAPPQATTVVSKMIKDNTVYRILSAAAHGHHFAVVQLGYSVLSVDQSPKSSSSIGSISMEKKARLPWIFYLCNRSVESFMRGLLAFWSMLGWDKSSLFRIAGPHVAHFGIDLRQLVDEYTPDKTRT